MGCWVSVALPVCNGGRAGLWADYGGLPAGGVLCSGRSARGGGDTLRHRTLGMVATRGRGVGCRWPCPFVTGIVRGLRRFAGGDWGRGVGLPGDALQRAIREGRWGCSASSYDGYFAIRAALLGLAGPAHLPRVVGGLRRFAGGDWGRWSLPAGGWCAAGDLGSARDVLCATGCWVCCNGGRAGGCCWLCSIARRVGKGIVGWVRAGAAQGFAALGAVGGGGEGFDLALGCLCLFVQPSHEGLNLRARGGICPDAQPIGMGRRDMV